MSPEIVKAGASQGLFLVHCILKRGIMEVKFELKYCEMCGGLGIRRPQSSETYCERCARMLTSRSLPEGWSRRAPARAKPKTGPALPLEVGVPT
jgi:hypothetical protein